MKPPERPQIHRGSAGRLWPSRAVTRLEPPQMVCDRFVGQEFVELGAFFR
jgi:hypothetical protein